jgi:signal transduction histidine kinase
LRRIARAFWIVLSLQAAIFFAASTDGAKAQTSVLNRFEVAGAGPSRVLKFADLDYVLSDSATLPRVGWVRTKAPVAWSQGQLDAMSRPGRTAWGRIRFERSNLGDENLAIYTEENRDRLTIYVNGIEIFRNFSNPNARILVWNRPYYVPLRAELLHPGVNEIEMRVTSITNLSIGALQVGSSDALTGVYDQRFFWRITAPAAANFLMVFLSAGALLIWLFRRGEAELLFLSVSGALWWIRDYHFFGYYVVVPWDWFDGVTTYSIYFANAASLSFCVAFLRPPRWRLTVAGLWTVGTAMSLGRLLVGNSFNEAWINLATLASDVFVIGMILVSWWGRRSAEHFALAAILLLAVAASVHDIGRVIYVHWWDGLGFFIQPYLGCLLSMAFLTFFTRRALGAFGALEDMNKTLESHVSEARRELADSEEMRRRLEVTQAVALERERLMREMHDGVGSSLVTALAVAERQGDGGKSAATLRKALLSLKITVDSLEPVEGDLVALVGNLRHRLAPDLRRAGVTVRWRMEPCAPLPWLDAPSALNVLRVIQEAIGNVLAHAGATEIEIGCREERRAGVAGLLAFVGDNGRGFDALAERPAGRGLANMQSRAAAMGGLFSCGSRPGGGTMISLWLPLDRTARSDAELPTAAE